MPPTPLYDFVFAGGGLSALSLAYRLVQTPGLRDRSILIVDPDEAHPTAHTWCFWADRPMPFDHLIRQSWPRLRLLDQDYQQTLELGPFHYHLIRGHDFFSHVRAALAEHPTVTFLPERVTRLEDGSAAGGVVAGNHIYAGRWVFDSRFRPVDTLRALAPLRAADAQAAAQSIPLSSSLPRGVLASVAAAERARYHTLCQHFVGWTIETDAPVFDTSAATFCDFRAPTSRRPEGEWRFFYLLPLAPNRAQVDYVTLTSAEADQAIRHYLERVLDIGEYRVVSRERGVNPLTDRPFPRRTGRHVLTLGTAGGRVKPSAGYAFTRIQRDSDAVVRSLQRYGHPFAVPPDPLFYRLCDALLLNVLEHQGRLAPALFRRLFARNPPARILRFLDERSGPVENLQIIASMPVPLFLRAFLRVLRRQLF
ncbi:MAG: Lycopene cyclase [Anaerolineales bacterium]|nr:Lycopene cyclase [Anaerolineales bacterium]